MFIVVATVDEGVLLIFGYSFGFSFLLSNHSSIFYTHTQGCRPTAAYPSRDGAKAAGLHNGQVARLRSHTHARMDNLELQVGLACTFLDCGGKSG